jgi:hypothetical protein
MRIVPRRTTAAGSGVWSMQALMHDQPEPSCHGPEKSAADSHDTEHDGAKQQGGGKRSFWVGREHSSV